MPRFAVYLAVGACALWRLAGSQTPVPPVLDMHLHAIAADANGPPPLGLCLGLPGLP